ncbi:4-hydroxy-tetrahydrodipicolinate reductase [Saxibacter everestensis]|uniref:4-hydroxy-tetrahydrodipicolinate reductase n=1 Tax=Saxibacter everestensis TaxID=2909229 RepID=A0ABY8QXK4_9MICO|nr:4-hydroxy-tetrahydrodipicolinate reductase [Brevibacteriaceae bacterium ZFBP1038]
MAALKVAVIGANGRMGQQAVAAIRQADDLELVAEVSRGDDLTNVVDAGAQIAVELTVPASTKENLRFLVGQGIHCVVGTTGWDEQSLGALREQAAARPGVGVLIAPNFSIGAVLAMHFAAQAARFFESAEVIELHHPNKVDAPSGTAVHTAEGIAAARSKAGLGASPDATQHGLDGARGAVVGDVHIHSVRLRGLVAHEEILFGSPGEQLVIRTDSFDRTSFMPGILTAVRSVQDHPGVTVGLDKYLDLR